MAGVWYYARRIGFYSLVDVAWSWSFIATVGMFAWLSPGWIPRRLLIASVVILWAGRLGHFLFLRLRHHFPQEDSRYVTLRQSYGSEEGRKFFWFFQYQAWSVVFLSSIFLVIAFNPQPDFHFLEVLGFSLWLLAWVGEIVADRQMAFFKNQPNNRGKVCEYGLWAYSRHPNYFFESLLWWSYFVIALAAPGGVFTLPVPAAMLFLLLKVTGVPYSEAQSLKSRGDAYRDYQSRVSKFFPWFPAKGKN